MTGPLTSRDRTTNINLGVPERTPVLRRDRAVIETVLGLPPRTVKAVERRRNRDYAVLIDPRTVNHHLRRNPGEYSRLRTLINKRVIRIPARAVHHRQRGGRKVRGRNRRLHQWALLGRASLSPAADPARLERGDRMLDQFRCALGREAHRSGVSLFLHDSTQPNPEGPE